MDGRPPSARISLPWYTSTDHFLLYAFYQFSSSRISCWNVSFWPETPQQKRQPQVFWLCHSFISAISCPDMSGR
jgi:hypothetical protein